MHHAVGVAQLGEGALLAERLGEMIDKERERLRERFATEEEYTAFFASDALKKVFDDLVVNKLAISQITLLLQDNPLSTSEIAQGLGMNASEVSRHLKTSTMHGLVRFDEGLKRYALA